MAPALRSYQVEGRDFLASKSHALLADEMRVGKTPQAILAAHKIGAERVLVVCPAIAVEQWRREWAKWWPCEPGAIPDWIPDVTVVSYDMLRRRLADYTCNTYDVVIVDEAHYAKTPDAKRTKAVYGRNGIGQCSKRLWALSGTPTPNHAGELWPLLKVFGVVKCDYETFVRHFCYYDEERGRVWGNNKRYLAELRALIKPVVLRRTRKQVAPDMPGVSFNQVHVTPVRGVDLNSDNPLNVDPQNRVDVAMAKAPQVVELVEQAIYGRLLEQTVVFGYHKAPLERMVDEFNIGSGIRTGLITGETSQKDRAYWLTEFQSGRLPVLCAQMIAAGTAIDLSRARHGYMLELDYVPGNNEQAANRLVSMEKLDPVTIDVVTWPGSKDDSVQRTLLRKIDTAVF